MQTGYPKHGTFTNLAVNTTRECHKPRISLGSVLFAKPKSSEKDVVLFLKLLRLTMNNGPYQIVFFFQTRQKHPLVHKGSIQNNPYQDKFVYLSETARACGDPSQIPNGCKEQSMGGAKATACGCTGDLCNGATSSTISITAVLTLVAAVFVYKNVV